MPVLKAGTQPLGDLAEFLVPFSGLIPRSESRHALECYTMGLLADTTNKTAAALGRVVPATTGQQLQELLTRTAWDVVIFHEHDPPKLRVSHEDDPANAVSFSRA